MSAGGRPTFTDTYNPRGNPQIFHDILGKSAQVVSNDSANLDLVASDGKNLNGIPYAVSGKARLVQTKVTEWLASYADPIKLVLGTHIQKSNRVVIKRKHVVGQSAIITPEHTPAQSVAVQEEVLEVRLARYGGDIEMNLNLFLSPDEAREEFDMKLAAQKSALQTELTMLGYRAILKQGLSLEQAYMKATGRSDKRIYQKMVFGAMAKHPFPVPNLMSAAAQAGVYNTGTTQPILILPTGVMDLVKYTRPDSMKYSISGFSQSDHKTIYMESPGVYYDDQLGVRIAIAKRHPKIDDYAVAGLDGPTRVRPTDDSKRHLSEVVNILVVYKNDTGDPKKIPHPQKKGQWYVLPGKHKMVVQHKCVMGSAILCTEPGPDSGEMLFAYPSTSVSTDVQSEIMKVQLRVYLGAALYKRDKFLVLKHVSFERLLYTLALPPVPINGIGDVHPAGGGPALAAATLPTLRYFIDGGGNVNDYDTWQVQQDRIDLTNNQRLPMIKRDTASGQNRLYGVRTWEELDLEKPNRDFYNDDDIKRMVLAEENNATKDDFDHGALYTMDGELIDQNTGKLGSLDHPRMISRIEGLQYYSNTEPKI